MYRMMMLASLTSLALVACGDTPKKSRGVPAMSSTNGSNNVTNNNMNRQTNTSTNGATNGETNNVTNNKTNNVTNSGTNNTTNNNTTPTDPLIQKCADFCETRIGACVTDNCALPPETETFRQNALSGCLGTGTDSCVTRYRNDTSYRALVDNGQVGDCFDKDVELERCSVFGFEVCGCPLPVLGQACTSDNQCDGGLLVTQCVTQAQGGPPGGECGAFNCNPGVGAEAQTVVKGDGTGCGTENLCYVSENSNTGCIKGCTSNGQCRDGQECRLEFDFPDGPYGYCAPIQD